MGALVLAFVLAAVTATVLWSLLAVGARADQSMSIGIERESDARCHQAERPKVADRQ